MSSTRLDDSSRLNGCTLKTRGLPLVGVLDVSSDESETSPRRVRVRNEYEVPSGTEYEGLTAPHGGAGMYWLLPAPRAAVHCRVGASSRGVPGGVPGEGTPPAMSRTTVYIYIRPEGLRPVGARKRHLPIPNPNPNPNPDRLTEHLAPNN